jgi:3-alpha domain
MAKRIYASNRDDRATLERLVAVDALPDDWRSYFEKQLARRGPEVESIAAWTSASICR